MTFSGTSLTNLAGAFGRTFSANRSVRVAEDSEFDIYERTPSMRADIEEMLSLEIQANGRGKTDVIPRLIYFGGQLIDRLAVFLCDLTKCGPKRVFQ